MKIDWPETAWKQSSPRGFRLSSAINTASFQSVRHGMARGVCFRKAPYFVSVFRFFICLFFAFFPLLCLQAQTLANSICVDFESAALETLAHWLDGGGVMWPSGTTGVVLRASPHCFRAQIDDFTGAVEFRDDAGLLLASVGGSDIFRPALAWALKTGASADAPLCDVPLEWRPSHVVFEYGPLLGCQQISEIQSFKSSPRRSFAAPLAANGLRFSGISVCGASIDFDAEWGLSALSSANSLDLFSSCGNGVWKWFSRFDVPPNAVSASFSLNAETVFAERADDLAAMLSTGERMVSGVTVITNADFSGEPHLLAAMGAGYIPGAISTKTNFITSPKSAFFRLGTLLDTDGDGLTDAFERLVSRTNPLSPDSDGDSLGDAWEHWNGLDPNNGLQADGANGDPDADGLPNAYELRHGNNPRIADSASVPRLAVRNSPSAPGEFATIAEAFAASEPYGIIEVEDGVYEESGVFFPSHPVMLTSGNFGKSRRAVIRDAGGKGVSSTFFIGSGAGNGTIVRGLRIRMAPSPDSFRTAFWIGASSPFSNEPGASPIFDGVSVDISGDGLNRSAFFIRSHATQAIVFANCVVSQRLGVGNGVRGVYAVDPPPLIFENCSFLGDARSARALGLQLETSPRNAGSAPPVIPVSFANCLWDGAFAATNSGVRAPFARLEQNTQTAFRVSMENCVLPSEISDYPQYFAVDEAEGVFTAPIAPAIGGHLRAAIPFSGIAPRFSVLDFEGQGWDSATPPIGADAFLELPPGDFDGDGVSNWVEVVEYGSSPYLEDSDGDSFPDGIEIANGSDPADFRDWITSVSVEVTNVFSSALANFVYLSSSSNLAAGAAPDAVFFGGGVLSARVRSTGAESWALAVCDLNGNGVADMDSEPCYKWKITAEPPFALFFEINDFDGDGVCDLEELSEGTSPMDASECCIDLSMAPNRCLARIPGAFAGISVSEDESGVIASAPIAPDGSFAIPHTLVLTNAHLRFALFRHGSHFFSAPFKPSAHENWIPADGALFTADSDADGMPDWWEAFHGLDPDDRSDAFADPDTDFLINMHEYWSGTDPLSCEPGLVESNALANATHAIHSRIAGKDPASALPIFDDYMANMASGAFIRNTNCWAYGLDLTCASPWNSNNDNKKAGTLISPRHVLFVVHENYTPSVNTSIKFIGSDGSVISRTIIATLRHPDCPPPPDGIFPDIAIGLLNEPVPTNLVSYARVLPYGYEMYLGSGNRLPCIRLDQEEKATVGDVSLISNGKYTSAIVPADTNRRLFYEEVIRGDSGNPMFIVLNGYPIVLTLWTDGVGGRGTSISVFRNDINAMMDSLGGGYRLDEIDLSDFSPLLDY